MGNIKSNIIKASYTLKRLRDSGYKADKIIGYSDFISLQKDTENLIDKVFPVGRVFTQTDIINTLSKFKTEFIRCMKSPVSYAEHDARLWTILIDGGNSNVFLTFYKNSKDVNDVYEEEGSDYFEIYDGGQFVRPIRKRINTHSFEVLAQELHSMGIQNKFNS